MHRKKVTSVDRTHSCQFCGYPLSQRHHALPFHTYGENECTLYLCANCHELYHIVERVFVSHSASAAKLLDAFIAVYGKDDTRLKKAYHFIAGAINIAKEGAK